MLMETVRTRDISTSIFDFFRKVKKGTYILQSKLGRSFSWDVYKQSRFIELCLIRVPIQSIYMVEQHDGKSLVLDGFQRLSTLQSFLENKLVLDLGTLSVGNFNLKRFKDLPQATQRYLEDSWIKVYELDCTTPLLDLRRIDEGLNSK